VISAARTLLLTALLSASLEAAAIPRPAPEFVFQIPGGQFLLSQTKGKVAVVMFLFTTCPHCQASVGPMNTLVKEYGPQGFKVFGAAFNDGAQELVAGFNARFQPAFPVGFASRANVIDFLQAKSNEPLSVPIFVFIDRKGMIRAQKVGEEIFKEQEKGTRALIESLLKEPVTGAKAGAKKAGH